MSTLTLDSGRRQRLPMRAAAPGAPPTLVPTRVLFAGGGTGGHLYPAIAAARALLELAPGSEVHFAGSDRPLERRILLEAGFPHHALPTAPWRGARRAFGFAAAQARGLVASWRLLRELSPQVVVGLGGFPSLGPALAARLRGLPLALFEPNASAGKANRLLAHLASEAWVHFAATKLPCPLVPTGTPVGPRALLGPEVGPGAARRALGLAPEKPVLLICGGSQGSAALNGWVSAALRAGAASPELSYLHLAGSEEAAVRLREDYAAAGCAARVEAFLPGIGIAYRAASLAVVRGGGATLAELQACGLPAAVVPMPGSADDHQRKNAAAYVAEGGLRWLEEEALQPADFVALAYEARDEGRLRELAAQARAGGRPGAAEVVARRLVALGSTRARGGAAGRDQ
ncbi:MAG: glycosyltransferase [Planctomycetota bacterium]